MKVPLVSFRSNDHTIRPVSNVALLPCQTQFINYENVCVLTLLRVIATFSLY